MDLVHLPASRILHVFLFVSAQKKKLGPELFSDFLSRFWICVRSPPVRFLEAAMSTVFCNILEVEPPFSHVCDIFVLKLFMSYGLLQLGLIRVGFGVIYSGLA